MWAALLSGAKADVGGALLGLPDKRPQKAHLLGPAHALAGGAVRGGLLPSRDSVRGP